MHRSGTNVWFCDGSVRYLSDSIDIRLAWYDATRDGDPQEPRSTAYGRSGDDWARRNETDPCRIRVTRDCARDTIT
jgi:prepilin-type processing-associated H-X9-DG protein